MRKYFSYIIIVGAVAALISVYAIFKTTTTVVELPIEETQLNDAVTVTKGVTEIGREFLSIRNLIWKENVAYFIGESRDHVVGLYKFNGGDRGLYALKSLPDDQFDMKTDQILSILSKDALMILRKSDHKICIRTATGRIVILGEPLVKSNQPEATLADVMVSQSPDGKKIAMISDDGRTVLTYDLSRNARKQIKLKEAVDMSKTHETTFKVSPSGEYFLLADVNPDAWKLSSISIIGIDTGRYYVSDVVGINPLWSPRDDKFSFLYTGELKTNNLDKVRLGVLDCATRKITYYDTAKDGVNFARRTAWMGDGKTLIYLSYKKDAAGIPKFSLSRFDLIALTKKNFNIPVKVDPAQTDIAIAGISIALDDVTNHQVHMVDAENNTIKSYMGIDAYHQQYDWLMTRLTPYGDGFLGFDAEKLTNFSARGIGTAFDLTGYTGTFVVNGLGNGAALVDKLPNGHYHLKFVPLEKAIQ